MPLFRRFVIEKSAGSDLAEWSRESLPLCGVPFTDSGGSAPSFNPEEAQDFDVGSNVWLVDNLVVRASFSQGAW